MEYFIAVHALGSFPKIQIEKHRFEDIKRAYIALSHGLSIEEKYEIIISNYLEFEKEILEQSVFSMIQSRFQYTDFFQLRLSLNIKLVNLLTSTKLYIDQLYQHVKYANPKLSDIEDKTKDILANNYDQNFEYRFMEALRNHIQHRGLPIHLVQLNSTRNIEQNDNQMIFSIEPYSQKKLLEKDIKFKKTVLDEMPEKINLKEVVRVYIECISNVHINVRKMVSPFLEKSRCLIEKIQEDYRKVYKGEIIGLYALCIEENNVLDKVPLFLEWDNIRLKLAQRNSQLINLRHRFVTGKIKDS